MGFLTDISLYHYWSVCQFWIRRRNARM